MLNDRDFSALWRAWRAASALTMVLLGCLVLCAVGTAVCLGIGQGSGAAFLLKADAVLFITLCTAEIVFRVLDLLVNREIERALGDKEAAEGVGGDEILRKRSCLM